MRLRKTSLLVPAALAAMAILVALGLLHRTRQLRDQLPSIMRNELQTRLGRPVSIGSMRADTAGIVRMTDVRVADGASFRAGTLLEARRATISLDIPGIIFGGGSIATHIRSIVLEQPRLRLRRAADGTLSISDILRAPPLPPGVRFGGVIVVQDGSCTLIDAAARVNPLPAVNTLQRIEAVLDFSDPAAVAVSASASGHPARLRHVTAIGRWGGSAPGSGVNVSLDADGAYWLDYLSHITTWRLRRGPVSARAIVNRAEGGGVTAQGSAVVTNGVVTSPYMTTPVEGVECDIAFKNTNLTLDARGRLDDSPLRLRGTVRGFSPARLGLTLTSERMNLRTLAQAARSPLRLPPISWGPPAALRASLRGPAGPGLTTDVQLTAPLITTYGAAFHSVRLRAGYSGGLLRVDRATAGVAGGSVTVSSKTNAATGVTTVVGTATALDLSRLPLRRLGVYRGILSSADISAHLANGSGSASVTAAARDIVLRGGSVRTAAVVARITGAGSLAGSIRVTGARAQGLTIPSASAEGSVAKGLASIRSLRADVFGGRVTASGEVRTAGPVNLAFDARGIDLSQLGRILGTAELSGRGDASGHIGGSTQAPRLSARIAATDGRFRGVAYDRVSGSLIASPNEVAFSDVTLRRGASVASATGAVEIRTGAPPRISARIHASAIDLRDSSRVLGLKPELTGILSADLTVAGTYPDITASGHVDVSDATVGDIHIDHARAGLEVRGRTTIISGLVVQSGATRLSASGSVGPGGVIDVSVAGEGLTLDLLNKSIAPLAVLSGPLTLTGRVTGTIESPALTAQARSEGLTLNGVPLTSAAADLSVRQGTLTAANAVVIGPGFDARIPSLTVQQATGELRAGASLGHTSIATIVQALCGSPIFDRPEGAALRRIVESLPAPFNGLMDASIVVAGTLSAPSWSAQAVGADLQVGPTQVTRVEAQASGADGVVAITKAGLQAPGISMQATMGIRNREVRAVTLSIADTSLAALSTLVRYAPVLGAYDFGQRVRRAVSAGPQPIAGRLNASISLSGLPASATGDVSVSATSLAIAGRPFGGAVAQARLSDGGIAIDRLLISPPTGSLTASGTIAADGTLALGGVADSLPLDLADPWAPQGIAGALSASFAISGNVSNPVVVSSLDAADVRIGKTDFGTIAARQITVSGGRLASDQLAVGGTAGQIIVSGSLPFQWNPPFIPADGPVHLRATVSGHDLGALSQLSSLVESASGDIEASVAFEGTLAQPNVTGGIRLTDGTINLRGFDNDFTGVAFSARFQGADMVIEELRGASSFGGTFTGSGGARIEGIRSGTMDVTVALNGLSLGVTNLTRIYGEKVTLKADGQLIATDSITTPSVQGHIVVSDARIRIPATPIATAEEVTGIPVNPRFSISVSLARNVVVERGALTAELVGPMTITGTLTNPTVVGSVQVRRGSLRLAGTSLALAPGGTASFLFQPPRPAVIGVDVSAISRLTLLSPLTGRATRYTVTVDISGTVADPDIRVRTSPPGLSDTEALTSAFGGVPAQALISGASPEQLIRENLGPLLLGLAAPSLLQPVAVGPLTFSLEPGLDVPFMLTASAAISDKVSLSYSRTVSGLVLSDFLDLSYTISPKLAITVRVEGQDGSARDTAYLVQYFTRF